MKIPFDIKYRPEIESGKYSVQTTDGRNVRIICWDKASNDRFDIIALVPTLEGDTETCQIYDTRGVLIANPRGEKFKLVILTDEPELSAFEKRYAELCNIPLFETEAIRKDAAVLLDLARKELEPEVLKRLDEAYKNQDEVVYENGKRDGKAEILKNLPVWKHKPICGGCWSGELSADFNKRTFRYGHYVINADKLFNKLPKES